MILSKPLESLSKLASEQKLNWTIPKEPLIQQQQLRQQIPKTQEKLKLMSGTLEETEKFQDENLRYYSKNRKNITKTLDLISNGSKLDLK